MSDGENFDSVSLVVEADAVVSDAEAELRGFDILKALDVAFAGTDEARQSMEDAQGGGLVDGAEAGLGLAAPDDLFGHRLLARFVGIERGASHVLEVFVAQAEVGEHLFVGNAFATGERIAGGGNLPSLLLADRFVIEGRVGQGAGERIEHYLKETDDGVELSGVELLDELVCLLFFVCGCHRDSLPIYGCALPRVAPLPLDATSELIRRRTAR